MPPSKRLRQGLLCMSWILCALSTFRAVLSQIRLLGPMFDEIDYT